MNAEDLMAQLGVRVPSNQERITTQEVMRLVEDVQAIFAWMREWMAAVERVYVPLVQTWIDGGTSHPSGTGRLSRQSRAFLRVKARRQRKRSKRRR